MNEHEDKIEEIAKTYLKLQSEVFQRELDPEQIALIKSAICHAYIILTMEESK